MSRRRVCSVFECCARETDTIMHTFPKAPRLEVWLKACGNKRLLAIDPEALHYKNYVICRKHFAAEFLMRNNRLSKTAVPTLFLPELLEEPSVPEREEIVTSAAGTSTSAGRSPAVGAAAGVQPQKQVVDVLQPQCVTRKLKKGIIDMSKNAANNFVIREALREDMDQVCQLIKDLAEFEKLGNQVKITSKQLMKDGFDSDNPAFKCFVAELQGIIIGYALYYTCYSTWLGKSIFLEDLYVDPTYRKGGIGKELILSVAKVAYETNQRLDFHVLSWNPAVEFYKSLGAINLTNTEDWQLFRLNEASLKKLFNS